MDVINRPKHGFNVPIDFWLNGEWSDLVDEAFGLDSNLHKLGIISKDSLSVAKKMLSDTERLNGHTIFCYIMLNKWLEVN
jgi:asparagine synthase (glutamine-hydrolysing)